MENIIFLELKRRGFNVDVGVIKQKTKNNKGEWKYKQLEIDLISCRI